MTERCVKCQANWLSVIMVKPHEINSQAEYYQIKSKAGAPTLFLKTTNDIIIFAHMVIILRGTFLDCSTVFRYNEIIIRQDGMPKSSWREEIWSRRDEISSGRENMSNDIIITISQSGISRLPYSDSFKFDFVLPFRIDATPTLPDYILNYTIQ